MRAMNARHIGFIVCSRRPAAPSTRHLERHHRRRFSSLTELKQTHAKLLRSGELNDCLTAGKLVADIAVSDPSNLPYARALFARIPPPLNAFIWNSMIRGYAHSSSPEESLSLFRSMVARGYAPNNYTFPFLLRAAARLPDNNTNVGLSLHASLVRRGLDLLDPFIVTSLVSLYASIGSVDDARRVFDGSPHKDVTAWNALLKGYIACDRHADALRLFRQMHGRVDADEITMLSVVAACAHIGALGIGRWIHAHISRSRMRMTLNLATALVNMYARCGEIESAQWVYDRIPEKDVRAWSAMISGLALHGLAKEALELFAEMRIAGVDPDSVTLTGVLSACSHAGLVDEGLQVLKWMKADYGVEPTIEHYGCAVDLLARAGQLDAALGLIETSPVRADVVTWGALLVACRVHRNLDLGERVAREMLDLDPHHAGARVFLSNVYATSGDWNRVQEVRSLMKERKVYKPPGWSSIEMAGTVHEFLSGDRSHPQSDRIYMMIDEIGKVASQKGHRAATSSVALDVDEEDKEVCVREHSEKLAVAFGLINAKPGDAIMIVKNLRICEDCHCVMKLVSDVYGRAVVVRDRNRFHHFKNGACSCNDYW